MSGSSPPILWDQWLVQDDLTQGLPSAPGAMTQERSLHQGCPPHGAAETSITQKKPHFIRDVKESEEVERNRDSAGLIRYDILWKITKNGRVASDDTERRVAVTPTVYFKEILQGKIATARSRKGLGEAQANVTVVDTSVVVMMTGRSAKKVNRRFNALDVELSFAEQEMEAWAGNRRPGQELQVHLTINITTEKEPSAVSGNTNRTARSSATTKMLAERNDLIEQESASGRQPTWPEKLKAARCKDHDRYCQIDPNTGKHTPLRTRDLHQLTKRSTSSPQDTSSHTQAPNRVGDDGRKKRKLSGLEIVARSPASLRGATPSSHGSAVSPRARPTRTSIAKLPTTEIVKLLHLEGQDPVKLVRQYGAWQRSQSDDETWQAGNQKAEDVAMEHGLDIVQIGFKVGHRYLVEHGVKLGPALRWEESVLPWLEERMGTMR